MRLFFAVELSDPFRQHLAAVQDRLRSLARVAYTKPENLHLTLKFLGEVPDDAIKPLCDAIGATPKAGSFQMEADRLVCFPERGKIRIIGAGLAAPPQLMSLVGNLEDACQPLGFARESRPYTPHITLARAKFPLPADLRDRLPAACVSSFPGPSAIATRFALMHGDLRATGPVYRPIAHFDV